MVRLGIDAMQGARSTFNPGDGVGAARCVCDARGSARYRGTAGDGKLSETRFSRLLGLNPPRAMALVRVAVRACTFGSLRDGTTPETDTARAVRGRSGPPP